MRRLYLSPRIFFLLSIAPSTYFDKKALKKYKKFFQNLLTNEKFVL